MQNFGLRLRALRTKHGFTQAQLAQKLGISTSAIGMYEQGRREPDNRLLKKISELFTVPADYLLSWEEDGPREVRAALDDMKKQLESTGGLMFNGNLLSDGDTEKLFDAMLLAANIMFKDNQNI